uniref:Uncharacterized protein n=1 Tax=Sphaerodactylus townsendi TaxID=933632 RepID=A0ACB8EFG0_9SAUR
MQSKISFWESDTQLTPGKLSVRFKPVSQARRSGAGAREFLGNRRSQIQHLPVLKNLAEEGDLLVPAEALKRGREDEDRAGVSCP